MAHHGKEAPIWRRCPKSAADSLHIVVAPEAQRQCVPRHEHNTCSTSRDAVQINFVAKSARGVPQTPLPHLP